MTIRNTVLRSLVSALVVGIACMANSAVWAQGNFDRDICKELEPMVAQLKKLQDDKKIKRYSESEFAKSEWQPSISTLWALKDKLRDRTVGLGEQEPSSLGYFLTHSAQPSSTGLANPYVNISKDMRTNLGGKVKAAASYEMALAQRIVASNRKLKPADVFAMAVATTDGDVPLAMLVAHNLLKEAAYAKRSKTSMSLGKGGAMMGNKAKRHYQSLFGSKHLTVYTGGKTSEFMLPPSLIHDQLADLRPSYDPHRSDRLGPWYHTYGILFYGTAASTGRYGAGFLARVENVTRYLGLGSNRSEGKEALNRCSSKLVGQLNDLETAYDELLVKEKDRKAGLRFRGQLIKIRNRTEAYNWGKKIGRQARHGSGSGADIRALVREIYGKYPKGSELRDAFRRGYSTGSAN